MFFGRIRQDGTKTVCLSNKEFYLRSVSSVIKILVLLSAAVVRIGVNCARLFTRLLLLGWNSIYRLLVSSRLCWLPYPGFKVKVGLVHGLVEIHRYSTNSLSFLTIFRSRVFSRPLLYDIFSPSQNVSFP